MAGANACMGTLRLERNGLLGANACSVSPKPIFGVILSLRPRSRIQGLGICAPGYKASIVLASGGAGGRPSAAAILEKEIKFLPAFGDYVKVLESVRTDRIRHLCTDSDSSRSRYCSAEKDGSGRLRIKGGEELADFWVSLQGRSDHTDRRLESNLDGKRCTHDRRDKHWRDEQHGKANCEESRRSRWGLLGDKPNNSMGCESGEKRGGRDKNLRKVRQYSLNNTTESAHSVKLNKRQVNYFGDVSKRENDPKQNGKQGDEQVNCRKTDRKSVAGRYQEEHHRQNCAQLKRQLNSLEREKTVSDIGESENNSKQFGTAGPSWKRLQGKMDEIKTTKSFLEKMRTLNGNSDGILAETELTRSCTNMGYETEMGKIINEPELHQRPLCRHNSPGRIDKSEIGSHTGNFQHNVLDMDSEWAQQNLSLDNREIDAANHYVHSPKSNAFHESRGIIEEHRNHGNGAVLQRDGVITKKVGLKISRIDETLSRVDVKADRDAGRPVGHGDLDDQAAFKTFEVFTDIKNRPRVLRMELEERIQSLATRLNSTDINMPEWQFSKLMHKAKIKFTDHSILRIVQILGTFGNWRRVLQVVEWLQSRERFKSYKSRYIYTTVLSVLGKAKRHVEALNVFYAMRQELSSYPDLAAYHCIAVILGQAGLMKELFDVIDCMRAIPNKKFKLGVLQKWDPRLEPDLVVYNAVLNACVQQKQWEGAFWVLQELKQMGTQPSSTTYGLVMEVMLVCGKYNLVHEFFKKVQKNSIPCALNYKVLVNAFWREEKIDEAVLAVKDMERRGVVGSAGLYYDLARCLCSVGRCQEALLQIDKLCKVAQKPLVVTYTGLIRTCLDSGSIHNATYIFNQMQKFCSPNIITCNVLLKSYVEHGLFQEAKQLFETILEGNKCINQKSDMRGKIVPDKFTFSIMMEACIRAKHWDDFEYAYEQMLCYGYHFDVKRHLRMVMEALRAGKVQLLETTFEHLIRSGRTPPPAIVKERFCLRVQDGDCVAALTCLDIDEPSKLQAYSEKSWFDMLNANLSRLDQAVLIRLASKIDNLPSLRHQNSPVIQNLLNACKKIIYLTADAIDRPDGQPTRSFGVQ